MCGYRTHEQAESAGRDGAVVSAPIDDGGPVAIRLRGGEVTWVSTCDRDRSAERTWCLGSNGYVYAVGARARGVQTLMHRILLGAERGQEVHHKNGNRLDNRRENLELTTASEHQRHHRETTIRNNHLRRVHDASAVCSVCGRVFVKDRNHRGRQRTCNKACAIRALIAGRRKRAADQMLAERKRGGAS